MQYFHFMSIDTNNEKIPKFDKLFPLDFQVLLKQNMFNSFNNSNINDSIKT